MDHFIIFTIIYVHHNIRVFSGTIAIFSHLLDYSPTSAEQPQPTDAILVPKECMWDAKLRCPPVVEITRSPMEKFIRSFQAHFPPCVEAQDVIIINTPPEYMEETSDSDVVCLD